MRKLSYAQIAGIGFLALALVAFIIWAYRQVPPKIKPGDLPNSGTGIPQGWTPSNLSDRLHNMIDGLNVFLRENAALLREYAQVPTNDMFAAVALDYGQRYRSNLFEDINGEVAVGLREDAERWKQAVLDRAKSLGLW